MKHYVVEFQIPVFHADSEDEAHDKFVTFIRRLAPFGIDQLISRIDLLEDQPECPGYDSRCDGMWYEQGKPPTQW